jgi:hypothetical protein
MEAFATNIYEVIQDYRKDDSFQLTIPHLMEWAAQFGTDAEFVLQELNQIIPKTYLSKRNAQIHLLHQLHLLMKDYQYHSIVAFLADTLFLDLQKEGKSQKAILNLLEEVLQTEFGQSSKIYDSYPKKNFVYWDDVLATGGTVGTHLVQWLHQKQGDSEENFKKVLNNQFRLSVNLFCLHTWGHSFQRFRLQKTFGSSIDSKIKWYYSFLEVQNYTKWYNQALNVALPIEEQPPKVKSYLANLAADKYEDYAYRKSHLPAQETFFTSPANRIRYEKILLNKGIAIIERIKGTVKPNIRPLGFVNPVYKTYGLGTHFFTWRNISNTCPLVFWWEVEGHGWKPLFPVANRGQI